MSEKREYEHIKLELLKLKNNFPSISREEFNKAYLTCCSSVFKIRELGPALAELMTKVEKKRFRFISALIYTQELQNVGDSTTITKFDDFSAIMKHRFQLKHEKPINKKMPPIYYYSDSYETFLRSKVKVDLLKDRASFYSDYVLLYKPKPIEVYRTYDKMYWPHIGYGSGDEYYYLEAYIRGIISFREREQGRILSASELHDLMLDYYKSYNPISYQQLSNVSFFPRGEININLGRQKIK